LPSPARDIFGAQFSPTGDTVAVETIADHVKVYACETCGSVRDVEMLAGQRVTRELSADEVEAFNIPAKS
jgi:hypothetical protein